MPQRPARPERPALVAPRGVKKRKVTAAIEGRVALLHALAHIELNAIDLAADLLGRFTAPAPTFADDWVRVLDEESKHFLLLSERLAALGGSYGDLPAHDGLWQAAEATAHDLLARLAVVPLVLEARGLDVTPTMIAKLDAVGDSESAAVLRIIYADEIGHVAIGRRWFESEAAAPRPAGARNLAGAGAPALQGHAEATVQCRRARRRRPAGRLLPGARRLSSAHERLAGHFRHFALAARATSPLYATLAEAIAQDEELLALAAQIPADKMPPNMLMAAVQRLLHADAPLARFYPNLTPAPRPREQAFPDFRRFALDHADAILDLCRTRRTSTNEMQRAAVLLPAFGLVAREGEPLHLIEVGCAAGLLLNWDRIGYDYGAAGRLAAAEPAFTLHCNAEGPLPLPHVMPHVASRIGLDLVSVDPANPEDAAWLRALIWPELTARRERLDRAIALARRHPARHVIGDAMESLPREVAAIPSDGTLVVFHSFALAQFPAALKASFLTSARRSRPLASALARRLRARARRPGLPQLAAARRRRGRDDAGRGDAARRLAALAPRCTALKPPVSRHQATSVAASRGPGASAGSLSRVAAYQTSGRPGALPGSCSGRVTSRPAATIGKVAQAAMMETPCPAATSSIKASGFVPTLRRCFGKRPLARMKRWFS